MALSIAYYALSCASEAGYAAYISLRWFLIDLIWPASPYFGVSWVQFVAILSQHKAIEDLIFSQDRQEYIE